MARSARTAVAAEWVRRSLIGGRAAERNRARQLSCLVLLCVFAPIGIAASLAVGAGRFGQPASIGGLIATGAATLLALTIRDDDDQHRWSWFITLVACAQAFGIYQLGNQGTVLLVETCMLGLWAAIYLPTPMVRYAIFCICASVTVVAFTNDTAVTGVLAAIITQLTVVTGTLLAHAAVLALQAANDDLETARRFAQLLATTDALTGAENRRSFTDLVRTIAAGPADPHALLLVDIDHFKVLNDLNGHLVGDEVLRCVATRLAAAVPDARVARWGGEEFVVLVGPIAGDPVVHDTAERLRRAIEASPVPTEVGPINCTVSVGGTVWSPAAAFDDALRRADTGLYDAKANGRNRSSVPRHDAVPRHDDTRIGRSQSA